MSTLVTIQSTDLITNSRADINGNFAALNSEKLETSVLSTDTTLAENSDSKIPTQKAVKAYVDAGGNVNASETGKGIVEEATAAEVAAGTATGGTGARLFMNPSTAGSVFGIKSVTAGATITGATLPVPVYQNKTDNEFYACDANDTAAMKFLGFATSNGTDGTAMTVQFTGIVSGFTGLTEGEKYYVSDTVGTIANTPGTYEVLVGVAISETEILIQRGKRVTSGTQQYTTGTTTTVTCGFRVSKVRVHGVYISGTYGVSSDGGWTSGGGNDCVYQGDTGTPGSTHGVNNTYAAYLVHDTSPERAGRVLINNVTDTSFDIVASYADAAVTFEIFWEAEGEL